MFSLSKMQREVCVKFGASCLASDNHEKIGISKDFDPAEFPLNGLRHPPEGDSAGWYIWSGERFSTELGFFVPLHVLHLDDRCPEIVKYLGLGPGWRFLVAPGYEMCGSTQIC
jgi:hypothetical protein